MDIDRWLKDSFVWTAKRTLLLDKVSCQQLAKSRSGRLPVDVKIVVASTC